MNHLNQLLTTLLFFVSCIASAIPKDCIPAYEYLAFDADWAKPESNGFVAMGEYSRISPDGNYVLRSLSGSYLPTVTLMKLPSLSEVKKNSGNQSPIAIKTDLTNEAFPVQGSWRFLANPSGDYYKLSDIIENGKSAKKQFNAGVKGFYTTAAEVSSNESSVWLRSLSWSEGGGQLQTRLTEISKNSDGSYKAKKENLMPTYLCDNLAKSDGVGFTLPMLSSNGTEFSGLPLSSKDKKSSMRVYKILENGKDCERVDDLGFAGSKIIFGFPLKPGKKSLVVFKGTSNAMGSSGSGVYIYDRDLKMNFELDGFPIPVSADHFPGLSKDGRAIFAARWESQTGYLRVDPFQTPVFKNFKSQHPELAKDYPECITKKDVQDAENEMKK